MHFKRLFAWLLLLALALPRPALAQDGPGVNWPARLEFISIEQGLSQVTVYCILQDSRGFMWFGTEDGLNRYDGYDFRVYRRDPEDAYSLSANTVRSLYEDASGDLWVGTQGGGLNRYQRASGRFSHYRHDPADPGSLGDDTVTAITGGPQGLLWLGTEAGGLERFDPVSGEFEHYRHDPANLDSLAQDAITALQMDASAGALWVGTRGGGLERLELASGKLRHYRHDPANSDSLGDDRITALFPSRGGALWVGTQGGLERLELASGEFRHYRSDPANAHSLSADQVYSLFEDASGSLWVGTASGLNELPGAAQSPDGDFIQYNQDPNDPGTQSLGVGVGAVYVDAGGVVWAGTNLGGLVKLDRQTRRFATYRHDPADPASLGSNFVWAFVEDAQGDLWVGSGALGGGLNRLERQSGRFQRYAYSPGDPYSLGASAVMALQNDSQGGGLWVGTYLGGLDWFEPASGRFYHYRHDSANPHSLGGDTVFALLEDRQGALWVGLEGAGLDRLERQSGRFEHFRHDSANPHSLGSDTVLTLYQDRAGVLWVGTTGGLCRFDPQAQNFQVYRNRPGDAQSLASNAVAAILEDAAGSLWVGTDDGLERFDLQTETFTHYSEADGLANDAVAGILEDGQGRLWISSTRGLSRFEPRTGIFKNYDVRDGLQSNEFNRGASYKSPGGEMFFGGVNGFTAFDPARIRDNPHLPPVVITNFLLFNKPVQVGDPTLPQTTIEETQALRLSYRDYVFSFEFAALDYSLPEKNQYAYMLEGFDEDWNYVDSSRRFASYANLLPGEYIFRVKAANNDGVWNEQGATLGIRITPPPWETWWAYTLYVLAALLLALLYLRYRLRELAHMAEVRASQASLAQAQRQLLRSREEERARLARDLHDGPLQTLAALNLQLGLAAQARARPDGPPEASLADMRGEVRQLLTDLRGVCSQLRPPMLDTLGLGAAVRLLAQEWSALSGVAVRLDLPPDASLAELPGEAAVNLYRIVQEALTNVARHAQAAQIEISLAWQGETLVMHIEDDGRGFAAPHSLHNLTAEGHYGLVGMRERAALIGADFGLRAGLGEGVRVEIRWTRPMESL